MEGIKDADYMHTKRVKKDFKTKIQGEYHDLYVQSDTLLLAELPAHFLSAPGLAWQAS